MKQEILPHLIVKYGDKLNPKISSVIFQRGFNNYNLTIVFSEIRGDFSSYTTNLEIISDESGKNYFQIDEDFDTNKELFLELDDYSKVMIIDNLFSESYLKVILDNNKQ